MREEGEEDRISHLPDDLLHSILSSLSLNDAGTTTVLARRWRHLFPTLPDLRFSGGDHPHTSIPLLNTFNLYDSLFSVLRSRRAPLKSFKVSHGRRFDRVLRLLCEVGVEELTTFGSAGLFLHETPVDLFACRTITYLELGPCVLKVPDDFDGLRRLRTLVLNDVVLENDGDLARLLSTCRLIEKLIVQAERVPDLVINFDRLVELEIRTRMSFNISIEKAPRLASVAVHYSKYFVPSGEMDHDRESEVTRLARLLRGLSRIKSVSMNFPGRYAKELKRERDILLHKLPRGYYMSELKNLHLGLNYTDKNLASMLLYLLNISPNLQKLTIVVDYFHNSAEMAEADYWVKQIAPKCIKNQLEIADFYINRVFLLQSIGFLKFVLANAYVLKKMTVTGKVGLKQVSQMENVKKQLFFMQRASPDAVLEFGPTFCRD